jgi:ABC-2 type transport system ATP-binding protein
MQHAIELEHVTKTFGQQVAVDDLSLSVPAGSVYGFIGPNGSGKTTTLRMIMRIIVPDRGSIRVLGDASGSHGPANDRIGYLPEERGLYKQMKVRELLRFYAELKGHRTTPAEIEDWLDRMELPGVGEKKVEALSKGMSQKVQFIATIIAKPELVILDEPFSGLDPGNAEVMRDMVLKLKREGRTVIFSTHDMSVAEEMCDFIFMIYKGKKVLDGTLDAIQQRHGSDVLQVRLERNGSDSQRVLENLPGVMKVTDLGNWQELRVSPQTDRQQLLAELMRRGKIEHFAIAHPSLQDIFLRIVKGEMGEHVDA